ncbi:MAG: hypothetical protein HRF50_15070, partial [Phycisphaerae bacterium]
MVRVSRILRDYREAGAVNELLALWGFVDDGVFLTKAGHVGVAFRLRGVDTDGLTHAQRRALCRRMEAAFRLLDERCRVYQYLIKRTVEPFAIPPCMQPIAREALARRTMYLNGRRESLYRLALFLVLVYEPPLRRRTSTTLRETGRRPMEALRAWLSAPRTVSLLESELDGALRDLHHRAEALQTQIGALGPQRLSADEAFALFRQLVNYDETVLGATPPTPAAHLDYFAADSAIECHRDHLLVGSRRVKVLSMKEPPAQTFAQMLSDLLAVPGEFIACLEWQRLAAD